VSEEEAVMCSVCDSHRPSSFPPLTQKSSVSLRHQQQQQQQQKQQEEHQHQLQFQGAIGEIDSNSSTEQESDEARVAAAILAAQQRELQGLEEEEANVLLKLQRLSVEQQEEKAKIRQAQEKIARCEREEEALLQRVGELTKLKELASSSSSFFSSSSSSSHTGTEASSGESPSRR